MVIAAFLILEMLWKNRNDLKVEHAVLHHSSVQNCTRSYAQARLL